MQKLLSMHFLNFSLSRYRENRFAAAIFVAAVFCLGLGIIFFALHLGERKETIAKSPSAASSAQIAGATQGGQASLSGGNCANAGTRPFAVMLSADTEARPLSGIGEADVVVDMPVIKDGINRFMAVFQCSHPSAIGSIRSARLDFIPLAAGFDAIYAHWGGEHTALDELNGHIIDNLNALINPLNIFYRKPGIGAPQNGFSSFDNLMRGAKGLGYSVADSFAGYPRIDSSPASSAGKLVIQYPSQVQYNYDPSTNTYARLRGGTPETDALTQKPVHADVVVLMRAQTSRLSANYNRVNVTGRGQATIFQNGIVQQATWHKDAGKLSSKLEFLDSSGKEIPLVRGVMWIQIADPGTPVTWNGGTL